MNIQHLSKDSFVSLVEHIIYGIGIRKVFVSDKNPIKPGSLRVTSESRLDIPLSGNKHMVFASKGEISDIIMKPGELHYCPPLHWKCPLWDYKHEMSSIVYNPAYIRFTYIDSSRPDCSYESHGADIYYHTSKPLGEAGNSLLRALNLLSEQRSDAGIADLVAGLLKITLDELKKDVHHSVGKANLTKLQISQYIQENFQSPINRAHVAHVFKVTPTYVSRLFMGEDEENFNQRLRHLRLEHAALLLKNTHMSIDEITDACGYLSSTYFIAAFKKYFGVSPGKYRYVNT